MSATTLLLASLTIAQVLLVIAMGLYVFRIVRGPRAQDRIIALDAF